MSGGEFQIEVSDAEYEQIKALPKSDVSSHPGLTCKMYRELFRSENYEYKLERLPPAKSLNGRRTDTKSQYSVTMKLPVYRCIKNDDNEFQCLRLSNIKTFDLKIYELSDNKISIAILESLVHFEIPFVLPPEGFITTDLEKDFMDLVACHTLKEYPFALTETAIT